MWRSRRGWVVGVLCCVSFVGAPCAAQDDWGLTRDPGPAQGSRARPSARAGRARAPVEQRLRVLARRPNDAAAWAQAEHQLVQREGSLEAAVQWLQQRVQAEGEGAGRAVERALLSRLLASQRRLPDAERELALARAELHASELDLRHADLLRSLGQAAEARAILEGVTPPAATREQHLEALRALAELDLEAGDVEAARGRHAKLRELSGRGVFAASGFARALSATGRHALAADEYARLAEAYRGDPRASGPLWRDAARERLLADDPAAAEGHAAQGLRAVGRRSPGLRRELLQLRVEAARLSGALASLAPELEREAAGDVELMRMAAGVWADLGEPARAEALYRKAIRMAPRDGEVRLALAQLLASTGQLEAAVREYEALVASAPEQPELLVALAELLVRIGRADRAREVIAQASKRHPRAVALHRALAELYARWEMDDRARDELELLTRLEPDEPAHWVALGTLRLETGDQAGARAAWQKLLTLEGDEADRHAALARVLADHDQLSEALGHMQRARELREGDVQLEREYASLLERAHRSRDAEAAWQRVLRAVDADPAARKEARRHLVALWKRTGRLSRRIVSLEGRFEGEDADLEAGRTLAEALARSGPDGLAQAPEVLERLVAADPRDVESARALVRVYVELGQAERAVDLLTQLAERDVADAPEHLRRAVEIALESYQDARALELAEHAVRTFPGSADAHALLGELHLRRQQLEPAALSYRECLRIEPQRFEVAMVLGAIETRRGREEAARELYLRVLQATRDDAMARRAGSALFQLHAAAHDLEALEREILPLALARSGRPLFRRLLVDTYSAWLGPAARRVRSGLARAGDRELLQEVGGRALRPLLEALADPDPSQREAALALLGPMGHPGATSALLAMARAAEGGGARADAVVAVALLQPSDATAALQQLATGPSARLRPLATWALARVGGDAAARALEGLLGSPDRSVRVMAALGLGHLSALGAAPPLQGLAAESRDADERAAALLALAALGELPASEGLVVDLGGPPRLAEAAALALAANPAVLASAVFTIPEANRRAVLRVLATAPEGALDRLPVPGWPVRTDAYLARLLEDVLAEAGPADIERLASRLHSPGRSALAAGGPSARAALEVLGATDASLGARALLVGAEGGCARGAAALNRLAAQLAPELVRTFEAGAAPARLPALRLLARAGGAGADEVLVAVLASADAGARQRGLGELRGRRPEGALRQAVQRVAAGAPGWNERRLAVEALGEPRSDPEVRVLRERWLADDAAVVREAVAEQLGRSSLPAARQVLVEVTGDPEPAVARRARALLATAPTRAAVSGWAADGCPPSN